MGVLSITQASYPVDAAIITPDTANVLLKNIVCESSVYVGAVIYIDGTTNKATNALADSMDTSNVIGICESKPLTTLCNIRVLGVTGELFTSLDVTKEYFLSNTVAGGIQTTAPSTSGHIMLKVGQPMDDKKLLVLKGMR
jgi:hypothetical protein